MLPQQPRKLCGFLPGRRLSHEAMRRWPEALREQGYCPSTINSAVSAANSLLAFCGRRGWQVMPAPLPETEQPELTREEYLRLLQTARILEKERAYLLVKLLGTTRTSRASARCGHGKRRAGRRSAGI